MASPRELQIVRDLAKQYADIANDPIQDERRDLSHALLNQRGQAHTLVGLGGVGKTALAAQVLQDVAGDFEGVDGQAVVFPLDIEVELAGRDSKASCEVFNHVFDLAAFHCGGGDIGAS